MVNLPLLMCLCTPSVEYRPDEEQHCHKLTVLYRKSLKEQLLPHLHSSLEAAGLQATVIEGGSGEAACYTLGAGSA